MGIVIGIAFAVKQMRRIDKINADLVEGGETNGNVTAEGISGSNFNGFGKGFAYLTVIRHYHTHIVAAFLLGKR